jgi:predicted glycosyltransferase
VTAASGPVELSRFVHPAERKGRRLDDPSGSQNGARPDHPSPGSAAVMFYSHDTYGLGHLRRTLTLARSLRAESQLIVTGSPLAHRFELPPQTDYIKLPSVTKRGADLYESRSLHVPFSCVREIRQEVLLTAARHFEPDVLVVDNVPRGLKGELLPTLFYLKDQGWCRLVLGLRDVVDEAGWVRRSWRKDGSYELLDELYDLILVYGRQDVYDVAAEYGFSEAASEKTRYVGYLRREPPVRSSKEVRAELGLEGDHFVLVMAGGGGDGYHLMKAVAEAMRILDDRRRLDCVLVGGPFMPPEHRLRVLELVAELPSIRYFDFVDDVASYVTAADVIVSMGGYNSVCELLSAGKCAIVVPRVKPRREQLIRAEFLSRRGHIRVLHPDRLSGESVLAEIERVLAEGPGRPAPMPLEGVAGATVAIHELLRSRHSAGLATT